MTNRQAMSLACSMQTGGTLQETQGSRLCTRYTFTGINVRCDVVHRSKDVLPDDQKTYCRAMNETGEDDLCRPNLSLLAAYRQGICKAPLPITCWGLLCVARVANQPWDVVVGYLYVTMQCCSSILWPLIRIHPLSRYIHGSQRAMPACLAARSVDAPPQRERASQLSTMERCSPEQYSRHLLTSTGRAEALTYRDGCQEDGCRRRSTRACAGTCSQLIEKTEEPRPLSTAEKARESPNSVLLLQSIIC